MSSSNYCYLTCMQISQDTDNLDWYSHPLKNFPQFVVIHTAKGFSIVNEAEVDVFLELSCFHYDRVNVGDLISGFSASLKPSFYIWKFWVHILLKPSLKDLEYNLASMWNEPNCNLKILLYCHSLRLNCCWPFEVLCPLLCFPNLVIYWVQHFNNTIFRIWNNLARIPSPPLASFLVMLPKTHLTSHSRMSRSRWMSRSFWFFGHYNLFLCNSSVYSPLLNLFCFC